MQILDVKQHAGNTVTMSSREIAELTGKQHKHVLDDIRKMLEELEIRSADFSANLLDAYGRQQPGFLLPRREVEILLTGYSIQLRAKCLDRLRDLESGEQFKIPQTLPEALRLAADLSDQVQQQQQQLAIAAPKVEALDRIATADGAICITSAAKHLQMRPKDLFAFLQESGWIYRRTGGSGWLGYQTKTQQGLLEHKVTVVTRSDGSEKVTEQVLVTGKGMAKLALMLEAVAA